MSTILAIDDKKDNLISLNALIREAFPEAVVLTALDGPSGIEIARTKDPDVILLDILMPGMDGYEVCRLLKSDERVKDIPVVFLTALSSRKESRIQALEVGAEAFLTKPIDVAELTAQIMAMVKIKAANKQNRNETERLNQMVAERTRELEQSHFGVINLLDEIKRENESHRKTEAALRESEDRFKAVSEYSNNAICIVNEEGKVIWANEALEKLGGYTKEQICTAHSFIDFIAPESLDFVVPNFMKFAQKQAYEHHYFFYVIRSDGQKRLCEKYMTDYKEKSGKRSLAISMLDVTERVRAEELLKASEKRYQSLFEDSPTPLWEENFSKVKIEIDRLKESGVTDFSAYFSENPEAISDLFAKIEIVEINRAVVRLHKAASKEEVLSNYFALLGAGATKALALEFVNIAEGKKQFELELDAYTIAREPINVILKWEAVPDDDLLSRVLISVTDITEMKLVEANLRTSEEKITKLNEELELRVAERTIQLQTANYEMESFSYSVSHDLRAPLRAMDGFARILLDDYHSKLDDEGKHLLNVIVNNAQRMGQLIDDLLEFSRLSRMEIMLSKINMQSLVSTVYEEFSSDGKEMKIDFQIGNLPDAKGDSAMMRQVWANLISNAIKFTSHNNKPIIEVGAQARNGEMIYYVKDNGAGFDMAYADKLFGVFQRLHATKDFEGTGVGLAIVHRIISRLGGHVWAEGKVNEGATFYFSLPKNES